MKRHKKAIPIAFNMSLGLIPVILCMILTYFIENRYALSICALFGICFSWLSFQLSHKKIYNFILYFSTGTLIVLAILSFLFVNFLSNHFIASIMAIMVLVLSGVFFYGQGLIKRLLLKIKNAPKVDLIKKSFESSIVSARLIFIAGVLHLLIVCCFLLFFRSTASEKATFIIFYFLPILFFIGVIIVNQFAIYLANRLTRDEVEIAIVNDQGDVIGKRYKMEAYHYKDAYINPLVRIALINNGLLFLSQRSPESVIDAGKADLPFESYLEFGETLPQAVERTLRLAYSEQLPVQPRFTLKYHFKTSETNRLNYLYILYADDEELLKRPYFVNGKLWTFQQIEQNIGKNYFGQEFEYEYDFLKETVKIWEEFR